MNSNLSVLLKKFAVPGIFILLGLMVLMYGFKTNQDGMFKMSALFLFVAAILSLMYSSGKVKSSIVNVLGIVSGIIAAFTIYLSFKSVSDSQKYNNDYRLMRLESEQNLSDIRFIQKLYAAQNGKYAKTWDEFLAFAKSATMDYVKAEGTVPARPMTLPESQYVYKDNRPVDKSMTELEALKLSKWSNCPSDLKGFSRDTLKVSLIKTKFGSSSYVESREIAGIGKFDLEKLPYIPMTKKKWKLETKIGSDKVPMIKVSGTLPLTKVEGSKAKEEIWFGTLSGNDTGGSWE